MSRSLLERKQKTFIGERFRTLRGPYSLDFAAKKAGVSATHWYDWEKENHRPTPKSAIKVATAYGVDLEWIYEGKGKGPMRPEVIADSPEEYASALPRLSARDRRLFLGVQKIIEYGDEESIQHLKKVTKLLESDLERKYVNPPRGESDSVSLAENSVTSDQGKELESAPRRTEEGLNQLRKAMASDLADKNALANTVVSDKTIVPPSARPVEIYELSIAAGGGALVDTEAGGESMWFRRDWLDRHALDPTQCSVFSVRGESMEETLPDGCSILVDRNQTRRRVGHIYVVRTEDGLIVKRLRKDEDGDWLLVSDHPSWKPLPWPDTAEVIGEVKWMAKTL